MRINSLPRVSVIKIRDREFYEQWVKGNPRGIAVHCFEIHSPREGSEIQTTNRGEGENRGWTAVCKIIGWNEGNRTESACDRQPQMPDATRSLSRSRRPIYTYVLLGQNLHLPGPAHRKSLPRRQLSAASTSDWLRFQYNRFAIPSGTIALSGLSAVAPLEIPVRGTWRSFGFRDWLFESVRHGFELPDFPEVRNGEKNLITKARIIKINARSLECVNFKCANFETGILMFQIAICHVQPKIRYASTATISVPFLNFKMKVSKINPGFEDRLLERFRDSDDCNGNLLSRPTYI